jgi:hypothetical protein
MIDTFRSAVILHRFGLIGVDGRLLPETEIATNANSYCVGPVAGCKAKSGEQSRDNPKR